MPQYQKPFANLGAAVGGTAGAAGGGLLGALSQLLEPLQYLDTPRQALWNFPASIVRAVQKGDPSELAGALPGLAGGLGTLAGGPLVGAIAAGAAQSFGHAQDERQGTSRFNAPTGEDVYRHFGGDTEATGGSTIPFLLQALGDPLNAVGGNLGGMAGAKYGRRLENVVAARGPQYGAEGMQAFADSLPVALSKAKDPLTGHPQQIETINAIARSPELERMVGELAPGSRHIGTGFETMAFETPTGGTTSFRRYRPDMAGGEGGVPSPRPVSPDVVPAVRSMPFPVEGGDGFRVDHAPFSPDVLYDSGKLPGETPFAYRDRTLAEDKLRQQLDIRLTDAGENPFDLHFGNVGWGPEGKMLMRDPGASMPASGQPGLPRPDPIRPVQGNVVDNAILNLLKRIGRDPVESLRREIIAGTPRYPSPYSAITDAFTTPKLSSSGF